MMSELRLIELKMISEFCLITPGHRFENDYSFLYCVLYEVLHVCLGITNGLPVYNESTVFLL